MGREATLYLLEQGVRVVGTDAWSWDAPFSFTRQRFADSGDARIIWEGHKAGRDIGYGQMEKLSNLDQLPADGFWISCFPYKIEKGSAGSSAPSRSWTRDEPDRTVAARRSDYGVPSIAENSRSAMIALGSARSLAFSRASRHSFGERCLRCPRTEKTFELRPLDSLIEAALLREAVQDLRHPPGEPFGLPDAGERRLA